MRTSWRPFSNSRKAFKPWVAAGMAGASFFAYEKIKSPQQPNTYFTDDEILSLKQSSQKILGGDAQKGAYEINQLSKSNPHIKAIWLSLEKEDFIQLRQLAELYFSNDKTTSPLLFCTTFTNLRCYGLPVRE